MILGCEWGDLGKWQVLSMSDSGIIVMDYMIVYVCVALVLEGINEGYFCILAYSVIGMRINGGVLLMEPP